MNLYECHFEYDGKFSRDFGLIIANIDTSRFMPITGFKSGSFLYNRKQKCRELMGDSYEDSSLSIELEIVTCGTKHLEKRTVREIEKWLFQNSTFKPMYIDMEDDPYGETYELICGEFKRLYFNCRFIEPEKIESHGGIIGFKCKMETDSMMLWQQRLYYLYRLQPKCEIVHDGNARHLIPGDIDNDGEISLGDAQMILRVATLLSGGFTPESIKNGDLKNYLENRKRRSVEAYEIDDAFKMCDLGYDTQKEQAGIDPDIDLGDAMVALNIYTNGLGQKPVDIPESMTIYDPTEGEYSDGMIVVNVDSDIDGYIYPEITITTGSNTGQDGKIIGDVVLENLDDHTIDSNGDILQRCFTMHGLNPITTYTLKCDINYIDPPTAYSKISSPNFIRLVSGDNRIRINGDVTMIGFSWQNRRFI